MKKFFTGFSLVTLFIFCIYIAYLMAGMPPTYNGIADFIVKDTLEKTGAINACTAIVFDFRGYDTLGESFVLFTAVTGTYTILRRNKKGGKQHGEKQEFK